MESATRSDCLFFRNSGRKTGSFCFSGGVRATGSRNGVYMPVNEQRKRRNGHLQPDGTDFSRAASTPDARAPVRRFKTIQRALCVQRTPGAVA
jgi:hypothetical protein